MSNASSPTPTNDEGFDLEREPLDRPPPFERDWGGDGTDLSRPVRAHMLAALRPNTTPYTPPVDALRALGDPRNQGVTERRRALGLSQEHLPDLLRMARDRGVYTADGDTNEVWAPLHAFYTLSDLDASAAVPELIPLFDLDDDWYDTALPELLGKIGAPALEPIHAYLADHTRWAYGHAAAARALEKIAQQHPELREPVVAALSDVLRGSWGDVLGDLGVEPDEDDPLLDESRQRFEERHEQMFPREKREQLLKALEHLGAPAAPASAFQPAPRDPRRAAQEKARKQKNKRKMESAARKANRRKRR